MNSSCGQDNYSAGDQSASSQIGAAQGIADYPAAHSMDTEWFAVDKDGFVALMESNEPGAVPQLLGDSPGDCDWWGIIESLGAEPGRQVEYDQYDSPKPNSVGFFHYECDYVDPPEVEEADEIALPPYKRTAVPTAPVKLTEVPADIRDQIKHVKFENVAFSDAAFVQPAVHTRCHVWGATDRCYDDNGKVQPIPAIYPDDHLLEQSNKPESQSPAATKRPWWKRIFG